MKDGNLPSGRVSDMGKWADANSEADTPIRFLFIKLVNSPSDESLRLADDLNCRYGSDHSIDMNPLSLSATLRLHFSCV